MPEGISIFAIVIVLVLLALIVGIAVLIVRMYHRVNQGQALVINKPGGSVVHFTGSIVLPVIHRAETIDLSVKTIDIDRQGNDGLICKDNIRADIRVTFFVRVAETQEDVLRVAKMVGCARASDQSTLEELFGAKFSEALKTAGKKFDFEQLYTERQHFRDEIIAVIGDDLNGYTLEDVAIDYLEQTNRNSLDPNNILDAEGIRKITERTEEQLIQTKIISNLARKKKGSDDLETNKAMLEYERQQADAEARQKREIEVVRATERAAAEEEKATQIARERVAQLKAEEKINVQAVNKKREEQIAEKARERAVILEQEAISKEHSLAVIEKEREVDIKRIKKEREVEVEKKEIAEVVRDRVAVDKTVAKEEEEIKNVRVLAEATRQKDAMRIQAEGEAEKQFVVSIKAAEASEEAAKFQARQRIVEADAQLDAADRVAKSKIRMAEGIQAEQAAQGLADVRVREANASALEKQGMVEARVLKEKMQAEAVGQEEQGMVKVRLHQAEAEATKQQMVAEAAGKEEQGMVDVRVRQGGAEALEREGKAKAGAMRDQLEAEAAGKEALAQALEKQGLAEAHVLRERLGAEAQGVELKEMAAAKGIRERLLAEAAGLTEKATAMKQLDEVSRKHEEFRIALEHERAIAMERMRTGVEMAGQQAAVYGEAFKAANINIVGGDDAFYNNFLKSVSLGHSVDGFIESSGVAKGMLERFGIRMDGEDKEARAKADRELPAPKNGKGSLEAAGLEVGSKE